MRPVKGGSDMQVCRVVTLQGAMAEGEQVGDYLLGTDTADVLADDVSNLKSYRTNTSNGFADESNKAIANSAELQQVYGDLQVLNDGRHVVFRDTANKCDFMECDGLTNASDTTVLLNEGKTHFEVADVAALAGRHGATGPSAVEKLEMVIASPSRYSSDPRDIMASIAGRKVVPVASSPSFTQEAERACHLAGVCTQSRSGAGFATTIPPTKRPAVAPAVA
jgi:hypothetical protein